MLNRIRIGARLALAFAVVSGLLALATGVGLYSLSKFKDTSDEALNVSAALALNAQRVQILALEERRYEKDVFINIRSKEKVQSYFQRWRETGERLAGTLQAGLSLTSDETLLQRYEQAQRALAAYRADFAGVHERIVSGKLRSAQSANAAFSEHKANIYGLETHAGAINELTTAGMAEVMPAMARSFERAVRWLLAVALVALALAALLSVAITRSITIPLRRAVDAAEGISQGDLRQEISVSGRDEAAMLLAAMRRMSASLTGLVSGLRGASDSVYTGANEVAAGAQELSTRTEQQAAALQETAASMEEFSATVQQNSQTTRKASDLASTASDSARAGGEEVKTSVSLMQEIAQRSNEMNSIIEVIDGIAFQTNILALNASVEAARAGEQGRGFAVVAEEVRSLASGATESAGKIRSMLDETQEMISRCATQAERSGATIDQAVSAINNLAALMLEVSTATGEQINGINQVTAAVTQIDAVTQQNASLVQESSNASRSLEEQARQLQSLVARFQISEEGFAQTKQSIVQTGEGQPATVLSGAGQAGREENLAAA
ncbi:methyl-accepting chemotaxis protein [Microbulbifer sp.]|uniref:methyl-accepting chemotaxis protein n=1 Tax=Microbulbifer sp. TaxID=1908541 RepID=UPI003F3CC900